MAEVAPQITDAAATQAKVNVLAEAPAMAMGTIVPSRSFFAKVPGYGARPVVGGSRS